MSEEDKSKLQQPSAKDKRGDWERRQSASLAATRTRAVGR